MVTSIHLSIPKVYRLGDTSECLSCFLSNHGWCLSFLSWECVKWKARRSSQNTPSISYFMRQSLSEPCLQPPAVKNKTAKQHGRQTHYSLRLFVLVISCSAPKHEISLTIFELSWLGNVFFSGRKWCSAPRVLSEFFKYFNVKVTLKSSIFISHICVWLKQTNKHSKNCCHLGVSHHSHPSLGAEKLLSQMWTSKVN